MISELHIGPDRLAGLGRDLRVALHAGEHGLPDLRIGVELADEGGRILGHAVFCAAILS